MSLEGDVRRMGRTRPFDLLPREALQLIAFSCARKTLKAGETLFAEGEPADAAYFVLSGAIDLIARGVERRVEAGALIGETALMTDVSAPRRRARGRRRRGAAHSRRRVSPRPVGVSAGGREGPRRRRRTHARLSRPARRGSRAGVRELTVKI